VSVIFSPTKILVKDEDREESKNDDDEDTPFF
jgi:hypothetical protein